MFSILANLRKGVLPGRGPVDSEPPKEVPKEQPQKSSAQKASTARGSGDGRERDRGSGTSRAPLTVNEFVAKTKRYRERGLEPTKPELIAYARYLGIDPINDGDLMWIADEALNAPLPSEWTEHHDSADRIFYYNVTSHTSSWTHPLEQIHRDIYKSIVHFRSGDLNKEEQILELERARRKCDEMEREAHRELGVWSEHTDETGQKFYYNREQKRSVWTDPRPSKCHALFLQMKALRVMSKHCGQAFTGRGTLESLSAEMTQRDKARLAQSLVIGGVEGATPRTRREGGGSRVAAGGEDRKAAEQRAQNREREQERVREQEQEQIREAQRFERERLRAELQRDRAALAQRELEREERQRQRQAEESGRQALASGRGNQGGVGLPAAAAGLAREMSHNATSALQDDSLAEDQDQSEPLPGKKRKKKRKEKAQQSDSDSPSKPFLDLTEDDEGTSPTGGFKGLDMKKPPRSQVDEVRAALGVIPPPAGSLGGGGGSGLPSIISGALGALPPGDGLSGLGRARVRAGIKLEPIK